MAAVPRGGQVLLLLGEIDCREGLLLAVEKMKVRAHAVLSGSAWVCQWHHG